MTNLISYPKYESYKDSGVEWLGEVPEYWDIKPGLVCFEENKRDNKGMKEDTVLSLSYGNIIIKPPEKLTGLVPESFETYQIVEPGDIIVRCTDLQNDKVSLRTGLAKDNGIITSAYLNLKVKEGYDSKYLHYYLHALDISKTIYKFGSGLRQNLSFLDFKRLPVIDISKKEQKNIADFLDKKTVQIDQAVAIKEKQIELLKERKQILIQNAVTRGLDPNVPMKDSGVEWIGKIPVHWELIKIRACSRVVRGGSPRPAGDPKFFSTEGTNWVTVGEVTKDDDVYLTSTKGYLTKVGVENSRYIKASTFILTNSGATLGVPKITKIECCINDGVLAFTELKKEKIFDKFLYYYYLWQIHRLRDEMNQGATQPNLNTGLVKNMTIGLCSMKEQREIVKFIEVKSKKINKAISLQQSQIQKLKEYKATLIHSAVTGKIKVSN